MAIKEQKFHCLKLSTVQKPVLLSEAAVKAFTAELGTDLTQQQ